MELACQSLSADILSHFLKSQRKRFLVAIAGPPGSGKTTIASKVVYLLNRSHANRMADAVLRRPSDSPFAICLSIDGFHYRRSVLDTLPNREEAYLRRGAPWTFDVGAILTFIWRLREWADCGGLNSSSVTSQEVEPILAPSFDHAAEDPVPDSVHIPENASIVVLEGNYLLLGEPYWRGIPSLVDLRVFVNADLDVMRRRLANRHIGAGIESDLADAYGRVNRNDMVNAILVLGKVCEGVDIFVESLEDSDAII